MVAVAVGHEYLRQTVTAVVLERRVQLVQVPRIADTGIDERRDAASQQVRVVAGAGPRPRVACGQSDDIHENGSPAR